MVPSGVRPRFAESRTFCGGVRYLWLIRPHVQAVPRCPHARQRNLRRTPRYALASSSVCGSWRCWCAATGRLTTGAGRPSHGRRRRRTPLGRGRCGRRRATVGRGSPAVTRLASRQQAPQVTDHMESSPEPPLPVLSVMQGLEAPVAGALPEPSPPPQPLEALVAGAPWSLAGTRFWR